MLVLALAGCGGDPPQPPDRYALGADSVLPLDTQLPEGAELVEAQALDDQGEPMASDATPTPDGGETPVPQEASRFVYTYDKVESAGATVEAYVAGLLGEEGGFVTVDETGEPVAAPDYQAQTGTVTIARDAEEKGSLFAIQLDWTEKGCTVTVHKAAGTLSAPEAEEQGMTVREAVDFLRSLGPQTLGLAGTSMDEYQVYSREGLVMVDDNPCIRLGVYARTEVDTNAVVGIYLLTSDRTHLYRLEAGEGGVTELPLGKPA